MKKFLWILVAVAFVNPVFGAEAKDEHAKSDKKVESSDKASSERSEKESVGKGVLSEKVDACINERPEAKTK